MQKYELGPTPRVVISCDGMLDVRGNSRDDVRLESDVSQLSANVNTAESLIEAQARGNCTLRMPQDGELMVGTARGNLRVRDLASVVRADTVYGAASVRGVKGARLGKVHGEGRIRDVEGTVQIEQANGSLTIQTVVGTVRVNVVNGDLLLRDISGSIRVEKVNGSLAVRTDFAPETVSYFGSSLEAVFRLSSEADVRFVLPLDAEVHLEQGIQAFTEGDRQIVMLGSGAATVEVQDAQYVTIRQRGKQDEAAFAYSFALGHDLSQHLAEISAQLETKLDAIETDLGNTISDRVLSHVERRLSQARRQVAAAQRRVEREAERSTHHRASVDFGRPAEMAASGPGMTDDERLAVLTMLEEGKISVAEAEKLLSALEGK